MEEHGFPIRGLRQRERAEEIVKINSALYRVEPEGLRHLFWYPGNREDVVLWVQFGKKPRPLIEGEEEHA